MVPTPLPFEQDIHDLEEALAPRWRPAGRAGGRATRSGGSAGELTARLKARRTRT